MTPTAAIQASTNLLAQLANPAARALALGAAAGLWLAVFRVKSTTVRLFTWTTVLYAALAMPLLGVVLPAVPVRVPAFLEFGAARNVPHESLVAQPLAASPVPSTASRVFSAREETPAFVAAPVPISLFLRSLIAWSAVAAAVYLAVALLLLARFFVGLAFGRRLMRASHRIDAPRLTERLASRARASGLGFIPQATESDLISVPVTMGALRSTILLPANWREWDDTKLDAVVAHEVSHVARRDALTQRLSLLHRTIFWFSPLAWWLERRLADLAEQASDEAALACGADRREYARTLLGFFEELQAAPGRVWWQGVSMAKAGQAEKRVERILAWKGAIPMNLKKSIAGGVIALALPVVYLAAAVHPAAYKTVVEGTSLAQDQTPQAPSSAPATATAPLPPRAPEGSYSSGSSYSYGYDDQQRFVIVTGKSDSLTMSGSTEDARHVEELRKRIQGDFIWFQHDEKSYIIRDQATIDRARKFWAPQEELGKRQEELGKQQEALGKQQEELGAKMEQVHVNVPDMTAQLDRLKSEMQQLNSGATMEQVGQLQSELGELQSKIGGLQAQGGDQQSRLGKQMSALGEQQGKLGEQQGQLGHQQGELAKQASREMKQLLDDAIAKGTAQPER
jgi:beta-lactamase regulating signal transducer with metallopeptidase domain